MSARIGPILILAAAVIAVLGVASWVAGSKTVEVLTDDVSIDLDAQLARPRDILWQPPEPAARFTLPEEAQGASLSPDGSRLVFAAPGPGGDLDLYASTHSASGWSIPRRIVAASSPDQDTTPTIAPDASLWFASDRPGSAGGYDLWVALPTSDGWSAARHASESLPWLEQTPHDERSPAFSPDGTLLCFARGEGPGTDLVALDLARGEPAEALMEAINSETDDRSPAFSPAGDFLYFASDRENGAGGLDLYRTRLSESVPPAALWLGQEVNSPDDESSPTLDMSGFRLLFMRSARDASTGDLQQTTAREVYRIVRSSWSSLALYADLLKLLPWLLLALALVLLFAGLQRLVRSGAWEQRFSTLGLMARCVLASIAIHAMIALLLGLWNIETSLPGDDGSNETRVALTTHRAAADAASQLQAPAATDRQPISEPTRPTPAVTPPITSTAQRFSSPTAVASPVRVTMADASTRAITVSVTVPETQPAAIDLPESPAMPSAARASESEPSSSEQSVAHESNARPAATPAESATARIDAPRARAEAPSVVEGPAPSDAPAPSSTLASQMPSLQPVTLDATSAPPLPSAEASSNSESSSRDARIADSSTSRPAIPLGTSTSNVSFDSPTPAVESLSARPTLEVSAPPNVTTPVSTPAVGLAALESRSPAMPQAPAIAQGEAPSTVPTLSAMSEPATRAPIELSAETRMHDVAAPDASRPPLARSEIEDAASVRTTPALPIALADFAAPELPAPVMPVARVISGVVLNDRTSEPVANATIRLDGDDETLRTVDADDQGRFQLTPARLPEFAALTASAEGYLTKAINIAEAEVGDGLQVEFRLQPASRAIVALDDEPEVHHLGNDEFTGRINSQFQKESEGIVYRRAIVLADDQVMPAIDMAAIRIMVRGVQNPNRIIVNGRTLPTRLDDSPSDGSFGEFVALVPAEWLVEGENTFEIHAVARQGTDIDDFEFVNPQLFLRRPREGRRAQ